MQLVPLSVSFSSFTLGADDVDVQTTVASGPGSTTIAAPVPEQELTIQLTSKRVKTTANDYMPLSSRTLIVDRTPVTSIQYARMLVDGTFGSESQRSTYTLASSLSETVIDLFSGGSLLYSAAVFYVPYHAITNHSSLYTTVPGRPRRRWYPSSGGPFQVRIQGSQVFFFATNDDADVIPLVPLSSSSSTPTKTAIVPFTITDEAGNALTVYFRFDTQPLSQVDLDYTDRVSLELAASASPPSTPNYAPTGTQPIRTGGDFETVKTYYQVRLSSVADRGEDGPVLATIHRFQPTATHSGYDPPFEQGVGPPFRCRATWS